MAETTLVRGLDWLSDFGDFLSEYGGALPWPFNLVDDTRTEPTPPGMYDVGAIVREYQHVWLGVAPNHATPLELHELLLTLDEITGQLESLSGRETETTAERGVKLGLMGAPLWIAFDKADRDEQRTLEAVKRDLSRWRERLDAYMAYVEAAIPAREQDRTAVLWEVTAPLFLGWYGGPTGSEIAVVGQPEGFNPKLQHTADLGTPFRLANELRVWIDWKIERRRLLKQDLGDGAQQAGKGIGKMLAAAGFGIGLGVAGAAIVKGRRSA